MFRIARVRIKWINTDQHDSSVVLPKQPMLTADTTLLRRRWKFNSQNLHIRVKWIGFGSTNDTTDAAPTPQHPGGKTTISTRLQLFQMLNPRRLQVRVKWVGFGSIDNTLHTVSAATQKAERTALASPIRVLQTFDLPKTRVRVSWIGLDSVNHMRNWALVLLTILLVIFALTRPAVQNDTSPALDTEKVIPAGVISDEIRLEDETIRMIHSPLDIGQSKDVFDHNLDTLMRGVNVNPFILDIEFPQPQTIRGLMMDFGRMDFVMRVQVYGTNSSKPVSYQGEYRKQPDIPHVDMDFADGPEQVKRIYIEIEQLNPPDEVHIHVREIVFKN
jgi:hypothetical protein